MRAKTYPQWAIDAVNWIGDGCELAGMNSATTANIKWPNGETDQIRQDASSMGWRFIGGGFDAAYAAGYAYACGYKD